MSKHYNSLLFLHFSPFGTNKNIRKRKVRCRMQSLNIYSFMNNAKLQKKMLLCERPLTCVMAIIGLFSLPTAPTMIKTITGIASR